MVGSAFTQNLLMVITIVVLLLCAFDRFARPTNHAVPLVDCSPVQQSVDRATIDRSCMPSPALSKVALALHAVTAARSPQL